MLRRVAMAGAWVMLLAGWAGAGSAAPALSSASTEPIASQAARKPAMKAYCGVRCLYAAALAEGVTLSGNDLIRPEYVGSREGSSIEELELAARDHGLHTLAFVNGTVDALRAASHPVILHVESDPGSLRYDHFVLYLGHREDKLLVLDTAAAPGEPAGLLSPRDLELMWDGAGVIVSKTPIENSIFAGSIRNLMLCGGVVICLVTLARMKFVPGRRRASPSSRPLSVTAEVLAIVALAIAVPPICAFCADAGLLAHTNQIKLVEETHAAYLLPRVSFAQAQRRVSAGSAVFVDARYAADYGNGHIPGAINVPVTASAEVVRLYMRDVRQDVPVIVYCESKPCPFSKIVARALLQEGYTSVQLLDGGWEEWSAWKH